MKMRFGLSLAALDSSDIEQCRKWRNRYEIWQWCRQSDFISDVDQASWFERQSKDPSVKMYKIVCNVDGAETMVGVCGLTSIDWLNRRAEFSLYVDPDRHGRGYGREALKILLTHGFTNLNLNLIWGESFDRNPAISMFEKLGMKKDGTRRNFYFKDGKFIDAHLFSITSEEWRNHGKPVSNPGSDSTVKPTDQHSDTSDILDIKPFDRKTEDAVKSGLKVVEEKREKKTRSDKRRASLVD